MIITKNSMQSNEIREKVLAAQNLLTSPSITRETFESIRTLLKGIHPRTDKVLATCSRVLEAYGKLEKGEIIELSAQGLPEKTEEDKKRKRTLLLFLRSWKDLRKEVDRVQKELETDTSHDIQRVESMGKILAAAKGPLGIITLVAVAIVIGFSVLNKNKSTSQPAVQSENLTISPVKAKIQAIEFNGKKIALSDLIIGIGPECDNEQHYHAKDHISAKALDGTIVADLGGCGFGKVKEVQILEVEQ